MLESGCWAYLIMVLMMVVVGIYKGLSDGESSWGVAGKGFGQWYLWQWVLRGRA